MLTGRKKALAEAISALVHCNPFMPERISYEKKVLGSRFKERGAAWSAVGEPEREHPNTVAIAEIAGALAKEVREGLEGGTKANEDELQLYEDTVLLVLYETVQQSLKQSIMEALEKGLAGRERFEDYRAFVEPFNRLLGGAGMKKRRGDRPEWLFAFCFQVRRAFRMIYMYIVGRSGAAARLRADVWRSVFTHDMRRYRRSLYERMGDMATLITGPSGTGKELVARAIGLSRYIPFDPKGLRFEDDFIGSFRPLNISALAPTLVESELFGHRKGSFTGAAEDRAGWLEECGPRGTVFLDEVGDIEPSIQVKLLRVLEDRTFQRLGETRTRYFAGKIIAATNRDLAAEMRRERFREDLYYRLCSNVVVTPSLREQVGDNPEELRQLIAHITRGVVGEESETLAGEVTSWVEQNLGPEYPWPGNFRELEQCVRSVLIRKEYRPLAGEPGSGVALEGVLEDIRKGALNAEELLEFYCTRVHAQTGNYSETARRLGLARRTVKSRIDEKLLR